MPWNLMRIETSYNIRCKTSIGKWNIPVCKKVNWIPCQWKLNGDLANFLFPSSGISWIRNIIRIFRNYPVSIDISSIFLARLFKYWTSCFEAFRIDISRSPKKLCSLVLCVFVFFSVFQEFHRFSILRFYRICCGFPRFALTLRHLYTQNYSSDRFLNTYIYFCGRFRIFFAYFLRTILTVSWII